MAPIKLKVNLGVTGKDCHVELNGVDISRSVTHIEITASAKPLELSTINLSLINVETEIDGEVGTLKTRSVEVE